MGILLSSIFGYVFGSIPNALWIGKVFYNIDIREHGSGNLGGTNAGRTLGAKAGVAVAILDILKGAIAMAITYFLYPNYIIYAGFFATLGHIYPLFANFKGGKAVSTAAGYLVGITIFIAPRPILYVIIPLAFFFGILYLTKMVSLSAMLALILASIMLFITKVPNEVSFLFTFITLIVIYRHKDNIKRIINKEERKITWM